MTARITTKAVGQVQMPPKNLLSTPPHSRTHSPVTPQKRAKSDKPLDVGVASAP